MKVTAGAATSAPPRGSVPEGSESHGLEYLYLALGILMAPTLFLAQGQNLQCFSVRLGTLNAKTQAHGPGVLSVPGQQPGSLGSCCGPVHQKYR